MNKLNPSNKSSAVPTLRLLKVIAQATFVLDDGKTLIEQTAQPMEVPAAEWPTFATGRFAKGVKQLQKDLQASPGQSPQL